MNKIKEVREERRTVSREVLEAAVEAFLEAPNQNKLVEDDCIRFLRSLLGEQSTNGQYSPDRALAIANQLIDAGIKNHHAFLYGAQAAFAMEEFEQAKTFLSAVAKDGVAVDSATTKRIDEALEKWTRELRFRETDAISVLPRILFTTDLGEFTVELYENEAPNTVNNFVSLVEQKYFNGLFFFYSQPGQIGLTGCKRGDGSTNAGYYIPDELAVPEIRHHFRGALSMANVNPNEGSSVFGILHQPMPQRDGKYTVFGRVVEGMDVLYMIPAISPTTIVTGTVPVKIVSATVLRKQSHQYEPQLKLPLDGQPKIVK
jgi:peptidyl-prolyl cis-trans isomerase B (cyclophilin B)